MALAGWMLPIIAPLSSPKSPVTCPGRQHPYLINQAMSSENDQPIDTLTGATKRKYGNDAYGRKKPR